MSRSPRQMPARELGPAPSTSVGAHEFEPLGAVLRSREKCKFCYYPKAWHPVTGWVSARPVGDRRSYEFDPANRRVQRS